MFDTFLAKWKEFFLRMFDIREGEFRRVWLMLLNIFLLLQCLWIIKPVVNAQFLSRVGVENLPLVFLLVALSALIVSTFYSRLLHRIPLNKIMTRTYAISIVFLLSFAVLSHLNLFRDWMSYVFYIGVALFGLITTSQFWLLGNLIFSSLEAKRLFGLIGAGAIAGGISGGYLTSVFASIMASENLLFVAAGLLMISMALTRKIWMNFVSPLHHSVQITQTPALHDYPRRLIRNSKHLTYLALIMGISVVVAKLIEFQFSAIASQRIQDPDKLSVFFGFWFSTSNAVSLAIQLLVTQRLVRFLGVGRSLFVLPGALFAGAAAVLYAPVLWTGTTLKLFDISLKQSINKAATELLILPIPMAIKTQAKTYIDVFVDTTATGIGGILLIFIINGLNFSVRAVCIMILVLICVWIYFAIRVRREYVFAFQDKLGIPRQERKKKDFLISDASVADGLRHTLRTGSVKQILFLLARIEESKDGRLIEDAIPLLSHVSPKVREAALRCLALHVDHTVAIQIEPLLKDPNEEVRSRAFSTLLTHTRQNRALFIDAHLNDADPAIREAALVGLACEARDNPVMQRRFNLEQRLLEKINQIGLLHDREAEDANKIIVARTIGNGKLKTYYPLLLNYMNDESPDVVNQAIRSAGNSQDRDFIKVLLGFLTQKSTRASAQKALAKYEPAEILPILIEVRGEKGTVQKILVRLPSIAETMNTQQAIDYLFGLVQHREPAVRLEAIKTLHKMKKKFPHLTINGKRVLPVLMEEIDLYKNSLAMSHAARRDEILLGDPEMRLASNELLKLLERRSERTLQRIFWILGLTYPPDMILPLFKDIRNEDPHIRINTIELLDNILEPALKKVVIPIVEIAMLEPQLEELFARLEIHLPTEDTYFESMIKGQDEALKMAALTLINKMNNPRFAHLLHIAVTDENSKVKTYAEKLLEKQ